MAKGKASAGRVALRTRRAERSMQHFRRNADNGNKLGAEDLCTRLAVAVEPTQGASSCSADLREGQCCVCP